jgi:hypothetical protein
MAAALLKNQTEDSAVAGQDAFELGIGVFALPDISTAGAVTKQIVRDITYAECVARGEHAIAFKWVQSHANVDQPCVPRRCVTRCAEPGCLCIDGKCQ